MHRLTAAGYKSNWPRRDGSSCCTDAERSSPTRDAGFRHARRVPGAELRERYFTGRTDELRPSSGEDLLIAIT